MMKLEMNQLITEIETGSDDITAKQVVYVQNLKKCLENPRYQVTIGQLESLKAIKRPKVIKKRTKKYRK